MTQETVNKVLPWKAGVPAWVMAVEGAVIAGIGLFIISNPETASRAVLIALAVLLLVNAVPRLMRYYNHRAEAGMTLETIHGWLGVVGGAVALVLTLIVQPENLSTVALLFGIVIIISGVLELVERLTVQEGQRRLLLFLMPLVLIIAGVILVLIPLSATVTPETLGQVLALLGFALLAIGLIRVYGNYQRREAMKEADAKRAQLAKEIAEADKRAGKAAEPPAPVEPPPAAPPAPDEPPPPAAPVASVGAATGVPPSAASPVVAPPDDDDPEDPAVKAALEP
jgi:uncharacterized membrane protein HdeD (DUF308 family)